MAQQLSINQQMFQMQHPHQPTQLYHLLQQQQHLLQQQAQLQPQQPLHNELRNGDAAKQEEN
jgi:hypothetical protein